MISISITDHLEYFPGKLVEVHILCLMIKYFSIFAYYIFFNIRQQHNINIYCFEILNIVNAKSLPPSTKGTCPANPSSYQPG